MTLQAFTNVGFRRLTLTRFTYSFAVQIQAVVLGWQIYELKHDPLYLGLMGLVEAVPALVLALFSGYIVDRGKPVRIYRNITWFTLLAAIILILNTRGWLGRSTDIQVAWIYAAAFITGCARGFASPSVYSIVAQLIPRELFAQSAAWFAASYQFAMILGPALGGLCYAWKGPLLPYSLNLIFLMASLIALRPVESHTKPHVPTKREPLKEIVSSGFRYVFSNQILVGAMALDMFAVFFGGVTAILPVFSAEILKAGAVGLGFLRAAPSVGAVMASVFLIRKPIQHNAGKMLLISVSGFGLTMIGFGLSRNFALSLFFLWASGVLDSVSMVIRGAIVQLSSPDQMRGRITAVNSIFIGSSNELGAFESGMAAKLLGTVPSVVFGGVFTLLTVALAGFFEKWICQKLGNKFQHKKKSLKFLASGSSHFRFSTLASR